MKPRRAPRRAPPNAAARSAESREPAVSELAADRVRLQALYLLEVEQNRLRADRLHRVLENTWRINSELDPAALMQRIADTVASTLGYRVMLIRVREPGCDRLRACAFHGIEAPARAALEREDVLLAEFQSWLREEFKIGASYFISHTQEFNKRLPLGYKPNLGPRAADEWHEDDVLLVPLHSRSGEVVGYFSLDDPADRRVPTRETIELLEVFANHAAVAIENARLYAQLESRTWELEEAGRRMQEVQTLKNHFVSSVSHELRTPLTAIRAYVDMLLGVQEGELDHERLQKFLSVVNEESERLTRLIESLLDLNRFDAGQIRASRQIVDLGELVDESLQLLDPIAQTGQIALKVTDRAADTRLDADRDQLRQLVLHLGSNAVKFTPAGGTVTFHLAGDVREVTLQVEDTGIGIPQDELEKIFERFYQVDSSLVRRFGGTGLGLAISKAIVDWHGGRVFAESEPGAGSRFTVVLPRRHERGAALGSGKDARATSDAGTPKDRRTEPAEHNAGR